MDSAWRPRPVINPWIIALTVTLASIAADLATALVDPRLSLAALRNQRAAE